MPPVWCGAICRNAMNEICVESCAAKKDCSAFAPKPNLKLADMPRFPETEGMTREEKFTSVTIYLAKVVDHLQGLENEQETFVVRRHSVQKIAPIVEVASLANELAPATEKKEDE